jgi:predicted DNA-binding transcriptional regulator AlpA
VVVIARLADALGISLRGFRVLAPPFQDKIGGVPDLSSHRYFSPDGQPLNSERELQTPETVPPDHDVSPAQAARAIEENDPEFAASIRKRMEDTGDDGMLHYLNDDGTITTEPDRWAEAPAPPATTAKLAPAAPAKPSTAPTSPDSLLTAEAVATMLGVPTQRVYAMSRNGEIPTVALGEKILRYRRGAVLTWLAEIESSPPR